MPLPSDCGLKAKLWWRAPESNLAFLERRESSLAAVQVGAAEEIQLQAATRICYSLVNSQLAVLLLEIV